VSRAPNEERKGGLTNAFGDTVSVVVQDCVAIITIDRPPHNHLSVEMARDLADALEAIDRDPLVRASVVQSEGRHFCAGADLVTSGGVGAAGMTGIQALYGHAMRLFSVSKPIVAAVQGGAIGAGLGLALAADFRVAASDARFAANFVTLGFHPGLGMSCTLPRVIGPTRAGLMFLTGRRIKAAEALVWGLADELAAPNELRAAAAALAAEIARNAPLALLATRKSLHRGLAEEVRAANEREFIEQSALFNTDDFREGVRAVSERRPGIFSGR
jgi:enoyl-CoA hydratase/carnithine racemase